MPKWLMLSLAALAAAQAPGVQAQGAAGEPLVPWGKWALEKAPYKCVLSHAFGAGDDQVILSISPRLTTGKQAITLEPSRPIAAAHIATARVRLLPSGASEEGALQIFRENVSDKAPIRFVVLVSRHLLERPEGIGAIAIDLAGKPITDVAPPGFDKAMAALSACEAEALQALGVDPIADRAIAQAAEPLHGGILQWFGPTAYPVEAMRAHAQGRVIIRFLVAADGSVRDCAAAESSGNAALDEGTCALIRSRGHYRAATDQTGKAIPSLQLLPVIWRLPRP